MKNKTLLLLTLILFTLALAACGGNPVEQLEEKVAEELSERIIEEATGAENVEINSDGDSVSYSVDDGEGGSVSVAVNEAVDTDAIVGMGFNIPLPNGLTNGTVQRINDNDKEAMITTAFEFDGNNAEQFIPDMHQALTEAGFTYTDFSGNDATAPDPKLETGIPMANYEHSDGYQFVLMWDESSVILNLVNTESSMGDSGAAAISAAADAPLDTTLDGSMRLNKEQYQVGEAIEVTLVVNSIVADDAWVGIVPADTPHGNEADSDAVDLTYAYISDADDGKITLYAPTETGTYDVRLFNTDFNGTELASTTITVVQ